MGSRWRRLDAPDGHAECVVGERKVEQRPRGNHGQLRQFLSEPSKAREDGPCGLNFVEEEQRPLKPDVATEQQRQFPTPRVGRSRQTGEPAAALFRSSARRNLAPCVRLNFARAKSCLPVVPRAARVVVVERRKARIPNLSFELNPLGAYNINALFREAGIQNTERLSKFSLRVSKPNGEPASGAEVARSSRARLARHPYPAARRRRECAIHRSDRVFATRALAASPSMSSSTSPTPGP